jgi:gliding motility-associated-like protein
LTILLSAGNLLSLKAQSWVWAQRLGNTKSDKVTSLKTDSAGNVFVAGYFSNSLQLGTNALPLAFTANSHSKEIFLAKFDSTGFCYWARSGGEYFDDRILGMDVDADGNSVVTGTYWEGSGINIGPLNITGSAFGGGDQCFIAKHDKNGNALWGTFVCSNSGDDQGFDVSTDKAGNHYVVGFMTGTTLYCGGATITATNPNTGSHKHCYWLAKLNSAGQFQWARTFGNLPWDSATFKYVERDIALCTDDSGGVYITGGYDNTRFFGSTTLTSLGGTDAFAIKYDTSGNFVWSTNVGSTKDDWGNGICTDKIGNIYITGEHRDSLYIDTVIVRNYNKRDAYIARLDASSGKAYWGKRAGSDLGGERGNDVWADSNCHIYVCGDINEGAKFGDNIIMPTGKQNEAFVAKISPEGKWQWAVTGGSTGDEDRANAITKGKGGQVYVGGFFRDNGIFGSSSFNSAGSSDGFFARITDQDYINAGDFALTAPTDTILCPGETTEMRIPAHAYLEYNPKTGVTANADVSVLQFNPSITTTYTITAISKGLCPTFDTVVFTIIRSGLPIAEFSINPAAIPIENPLFQLKNLSIGATTYEWFHDNTLFSTSTNAQISFTKSGEYCFTLVATNQYGCVDSVTHCGEIYDREIVFFPNAFSPNGDALNDGFGPVFQNIKFENMQSYLMVIYNRWGEMVFETNNPQTRWNGMNKNNGVMENGVYHYFCKFTTPRGEVYNKKGDVTLVR